MTARDLLAIALGNLWRRKLRAALTIAGVLIAIAAFVALLSFGAGNRRHVEQEFEQLGLFSTMHVYPPRPEQTTTPSSSLPPLDDQMVDRIASLPGVRLAYPYDTFEVSIALADTQVTTSAQALSGTAARTKRYSRLLAGNAITDDSSDQALVTRELLELVGMEEPDSMIGRRLIVSVQVATIDSALSRVFRGQLGRLQERFVAPRLDSLQDGAYQQAIAETVREELNAAAARFVAGYMNGRAVVSDTLVVQGVVRGQPRGRLRLRPVIVPLRTAKRFHRSGLSGDPTSLFTAMQSGRLFAQTGESSGLSYPQITLDLDPRANHAALGDSIEALGFRAFSFAAQFDEMRKFFLFFDLALGALGLVALVTAALGIANTMMMSISERRREIGVLASLGADAGTIRLLFLVEAGAIGTLGGALGIAVGWLITRVASVVAHIIMTRQGIDGIELFATPIWLIALAFLFGLTVSLLAGLYPAARAAAVDPVTALRQD